MLRIPESFEKNCSSSRKGLLSANGGRRVLLFCPDAGTVFGGAAALAIFCIIAYNTE